MRLVFFGSPDFAVPSLSALLGAGHDVTLVVSQPARPAGRRAELSDPVVARLGRERGLPVDQPPSLKTDEAVSRLAAAGAELFVVVAYGKILPQRVLDLPRSGAVNVHGSLLPRWRGASPVQAAILAGDAVTGVTVMKMDAGMDTGPVYAVEETRIEVGETAETLGARLATMGADLLVETLLFLEGKKAGVQTDRLAEAERARPDAMPYSPSRKFFFPPSPQDSSQATYCPKITREDGLVDWTLPALTLVRRDRAFTPWPGLFTFREKTRLKIAGLTLVEGKRPSPPPGTVLSISAALVVACGEGSVAVRELQAEGRRKLPAAEFARGERVLPGEVWPS
ncbi:MAG: methionyl-tRNA formyltransferase [Acidithiobacillales bacterium]